ncbi:MAG: hypothetical protein RL213_1331 [Bacteroidota bacterium]|jgi:phosphopantetheinyl transferase
MPIVFEHSDSSGRYRLAVWECDGKETDSADRLLTEQEMTDWKGFRSEARRLEFVTVRLLLKHLAGEQATVKYDSYGSPILNDGRPVSITHSGSRVAVMVAENGVPGIDLEAERGNIHLVSGKFISEQEKSAFGDLLTVPAMHVIWCAKEILFKIYRKGGIDFRKDLHVAPVKITDAGTLKASLRKPDLQIETEMTYRISDGFVLAWGLHSP